ncbi:glycine betaine ABC transporter substrate-binding protein [Limosilactobacillus fastidiosus]|uniref:Glycine/betaine ABC transporter substrate-binding protein n=1 Tax=Limosilactobacillus fastidiosus TaxID=2759855 RepID=A0ABR6E8I5_9LACO|nr:glycine betaine ABC transporter substrate-binding protein [Limosilactobacillus fastidiosus]MBB1063505.1 glycine/betaine ABC transporter substrate-binding protein [Limosilactobacillus fastidiosus]MCD7084773.1 glycine/betaine ABC transporter substrate-binding protein [Limosilactobacillus fastidiosus]
MTIRLRKVVLSFALALVALVIAAGLPVSVRANSKPLIVGSKSFSESKTVSEIYALALEHAGYKVVRKPNISNSVVYRAVKTGQIDVYPEYTGTIVEAYLKKSASGKNASQMASLAQKGVKKDGLITFTYAPGDNRQGIGIRSSVAEKYHIKTLSDLQKNAAKIRFVSQGEFDKRADALPGMNRKYGKYNFKSHKDYDDSLKYKIMSQNKGDAAPVSTTDGQLATSKFTLLKDDKGLWAPYNLVPLVNEKAAKSHPKMERALNQVDAKLTTKQLTALNKKVDVDGQNYKIVAKNWYSDHILNH